MQDERFDSVRTALERAQRRRGALRRVGGDGRGGGEKGKAEVSSCTRDESLP